MTNMTTGTLYIISAPSGAGKTSLVSELIKTSDDICVSISHTTREIRPGEKDGVNYNFVTTDQFQTMLNESAFLESAQVFNNFYGTSAAWVQETLNAGKDVILEIDWQGAQQIRKQAPNTVTIFILPPSLTELRSRLTNRDQDDKNIIDQRMAEAANEMSHYPEYDYLVINDDFQDALVDLCSITRGRRCELAKQTQKHADLLQALLS